MIWTECVISLPTSCWRWSSKREVTFYWLGLPPPPANPWGTKRLPSRTEMQRRGRAQGWTERRAATLLGYYRMELRKYKVCYYGSHGKRRRAQGWTERRAGSRMGRGSTMFAWVQAWRDEASSGPLGVIWKTPNLGCWSIVQTLARCQMATKVKARGKWPMFGSWGWR